MRKQIFWIALFLSLTSLSQSVPAAFSSSFECLDPNCREGTEANVTFMIWNNINKTTHLGSIIIKEPETSRVIASYLPEGVKLLPDEKKKIVFPTILKPPKEGVRTFKYMTCIEAVTSTNESIDEAGIVCADTIPTMTILPLSRIECEKDDDCPKGKFCDERFFKCKDIPPSTGIVFLKGFGAENISGIPLLVVLLVLLVLLVRWKYKRKGQYKHKASEYL